MVELQTVYRQPGRFAGWPANYGMWNWGSEIVVIFTEGTYKASTISHARDKSQPFTTLQARSLNGGKTWNVTPFPGNVPGNRPLSADEHVLPELSLEAFLAKDDSQLLRCDGGIPFSHPDFAMLCGRTGLDAGTQSFFYTTYDRCKTWQGPYQLPMFGQTAIAARTAYQIEDANTALLFLTANKTDGNEGRVFCCRTTDSGASFKFVSFIGEEPGRGGFSIMPSHLHFPDGHYLTAIRCRGNQNDDTSPPSWIDLYTSHDRGSSWQHLNRPIIFNTPDSNSNPPSLVALPDGRIALIYGNRDAPAAICARISSDQGTSWSDEVILRPTGGTSDMGYTRAVVLPDGTIVTTYYLNDQADGNGERFIESLRWKPD